jgi:hypothetical protein
MPDIVVVHLVVLKKICLINTGSFPQRMAASFKTMTGSLSGCYRMGNQKKHNKKLVHQGIL